MENIVAEINRIREDIQDIKNTTNIISNERKTNERKTNDNLINIITKTMLSFENKKCIEINLSPQNFASYFKKCRIEKCGGFFHPSDASDAFLRVDIGDGDTYWLFFKENICYNNTLKIFDMFKMANQYGYVIYNYIEQVTND